MFCVFGDLVLQYWNLELFFARNRAISGEIAAMKNEFVVAISREIARFRLKKRDFALFRAKNISPKNTVKTPNFD